MCLVLNVILLEDKQRQTRITVISIICYVKLEMTKH